MGDATASALADISLLDMSIQNGVSLFGSAVKIIGQLASSHHPYHQSKDENSVSRNNNDLLNMLVDESSNKAIKCSNAPIDFSVELRMKVLSLSADSSHPSGIVSPTVTTTKNAPKKSTVPADLLVEWTDLVRFLLPYLNFMSVMT